MHERRVAVFRLIMFVALYLICLRSKLRINGNF